MSNMATDQIYGNCQVLSPKGVLMFLCTLKKMQWYLDNHLAKVVEGNSLSIKLTFQPKGDGHSGKYYYLMPRENKCVVCAAEKNLTRHHVVPQCYRKHFPISLKKGVSHDIVVTCMKCHAKAEREYDLLKTTLAVSYEAPLNGIGMVFDPELDQAQRALRAIIWYEGSIPEIRLEILFNRVERYLEASLDELSRSDIKKFLDATSSWKGPEYKTHGELVVSQLDDDYEWFICMWRAYFLEHMSPRYMPSGWSIEHGFNKVEKK